MDILSNDRGSVLTDARRKRFEGLGLDFVQADLARGGHVHIGGPQAQEAARLWVAEKNLVGAADAKTDGRRKRSGMSRSSGGRLQTAANVLAGVAVGLFLGWLVWGLR